MAPILPFRASIRCHIALKLLRWLSVESLSSSWLRLLSPCLLFRRKRRRNRGRVAKHHTVILQSEGGLFQLRGPKIGLLIGRSGRRLGVCCVYYPRGPWDAAATMYPNIVTKGPGRTTLQELMDSDLAKFRKDNPGMTYVDGDMSFNNRQPSCAISVVSIRALRRPLPTSTKKRSLPLWC